MANRARCCGLLHPETSISMVYDSWQMICLIYLLLVLPWRIAFEVRNPTAPDVRRPMHNIILIEHTLGLTVSCTAIERTFGANASL